MQARKASSGEKESSGLPLRWAVILTVAGGCSALAGVVAGLVPALTVGPAIAVALHKLIR